MAVVTLSGLTLVGTNADRAPVSIPQPVSCEGGGGVEPQWACTAAVYGVPVMNRDFFGAMASGIRH
jgi:hypothetical protein